MSEPRNFKNITVNGTYVISNQFTVLHNIVINQKGATGNQLILKSGPTTIATIDTVNATIGELEYDCRCDAGIQITIQTGTAADITVTWT